MEEKSLEMAQAAIQKIKDGVSAKDVIKDYELPPIVNFNTCKTIGLSAVLLLNTRYDYSEDVFEHWKKLLSADDWYFNVRRNQLRVHFSIHFNKK